eukprot:COSAG02_NODE_8817_length_2433_cov_1.489717_1_plen_616_part_10
MGNEGGEKAQRRAGVSLREAGMGREMGMGMLVALVQVLRACAPQASVQDGVARVDLSATDKTWVIQENAFVREVEFALGAEAAPENTVVLLDRKQWLRCSWPNSRLGSSCPADGIRDVVRLERGSVHLDAAMRARASLANGTIFGAVELPDYGTDARRAELCEQSRFTLVLCASAPAVRSGGRPTVCVGEAPEVLEGTCKKFHHSKSWCSEYHETLKQVQMGLSMALLVLVLAVMRQVHQDMGSRSPPAGQGPAGLRASIKNRLAPVPQLLSDDTEEQLAPLLDYSLRRQAADSLQVYALQCLACVSNALLSKYHDEYDSLMHYATEGMYYLSICYLAIVICAKCIRATAGPTPRASVVRYKRGLSWYCTVLFFSRAIFKYRDETDPSATSSSTDKHLADATNFLLVLPLLLVLVFISVWTASKMVTGARTTARRRLSTLDINLLTTSQDRENAEQGVEGSQVDQADTDAVWDMDGSASASPQSEWTQSSVTRYYRFIAVVVIEVVILLLAWCVSKLLTVSSLLKDQPCIGCECHPFGSPSAAETTAVDGSIHYLYKYVGADADTSQCASYIQDPSAFIHWEKLRNAESPINIFNYAELVKNLIMFVIQLVIQVTV